MTHDALQDRLERYADDVRSDIGAEVLILAGDWSNPEAVRDVTIELTGEVTSR